MQAEVQVSREQDKSCCFVSKCCGHLSYPKVDQGIEITIVGDSDFQTASLIKRIKDSKMAINFLTYGKVTTETYL